MQPYKITASRRVYGLLKDEILKSTYSAGHVLIEMALSNAFGVSKTPVREALSMLAQEGLVTLIPRCGWVVTPVTVKDMQDGYELRAILEPEAARLAAMRASDSALAELDAMVQHRYDRMANGPAYTSSELLDDNTLFHSKIALESGNRWLASTVESVLQKLQLAVFIDPDIDDPAEHLVIVKALKARDPVEAAKAMASHVTRRMGRVLPVHRQPGGGPAKSRSDKHQSQLAN